MGGQVKAADFKAPGGKLVRVRLIEENRIIKSLRISGDFFLVPEEALFQLEKLLEGSSLEESLIRNLVERFFEVGNVQPLGISAEDIVSAILSVDQETIVA